MPDESLHTVNRARFNTEQIEPVQALVVRALELGFAVQEDLPGPTNYATTGCTIYVPRKRPPPTLVVQYVKPGPDRNWRPFAAVAYDTDSMRPSVPVSEPADVERLIENFLERYAHEAG